MDLHIVDTHAHLDMPEFSTDRSTVVERAARAGVKTILTVGIDLNSSRGAVELAQSYSGVFAAVGIHPNNAEGMTKKDISNLELLATKPRVVALGEMGLDFYRNIASRDAQIRVFTWQLDLAEVTGLPIIIHCRQAVTDMLEILKKWSTKSPMIGPKGIIHCFNGDLTTVKTYIDMGFYIALGGYIGYPSSLPFRDVIRDIPLEKLVLETDCPFLPPQQYRGKRNEPAYTMLTLQVLADIKNLTIEEVARHTTANVRAVLKIPF